MIIRTRLRRAGKDYVIYLKRGERYGYANKEYRSTGAICSDIRAYIFDFSIGYSIQANNRWDIELGNPSRGASSHVINTRCFLSACSYIGTQNECSAISRSDNLFGLCQARRYVCSTAAARDWHVDTVEEDEGNYHESWQRRRNITQILPEIL